jgi:hypothetical protein
MVLSEGIFLVSIKLYGLKDFVVQIVLMYLLSDLLNFIQDFNIQKLLSLLVSYILYLLAKEYNLLVDKFKITGLKVL